MSALSLHDHPAPAWTFSVSSGRILDANDAAARHHGFSVAELRGRALHELCPEEDRAALEDHLRELAAAPRDAHHTSRRHRRRDGSSVWMDVTIGPAQGPDGDVRLAVLHPGRGDAFGRVVSAVSHDFKHLLTIISAATDLVRWQGSQHAASVDALAEISSAADRARELTDRLAEAWGGGSREPVELDVAEVVRELQPLLARLLPADAQLRLDLRGASRPLRADRLALEQAVRSLVADAAAAGARLVTIGLRDEPREGRVVLEVVHDGAGTAQETFAQATLAWNAEQLGATLEHDRLAEGGARGRLALPAGAHAPRILLVEDEPRLRTVLAAGLEHHGYEVHATDGSPGLLPLDRGGPIDLLVADVQLAGTTGPEVARALADRYPGLPVLYVSGADEEELARQLPPGSPLLRKPFDLASLLARVRELLGDRA